MRRDGTMRSSTALRIGLFSWFLVSALIFTFFFEPNAASATTPLRLHGALQRDQGIGDSVGVVAHRGAAALAPENTLASFRLAIEQGVDFVETDVQLSADGVPVLMHDPDVDRTTNGQGPVSAHTYEHLRSLDAGSWFSSEFTGELVPTLPEFVELLRTAPTRAFVELKGEWQPENIAAVVDLLHEHQLKHRFILASFERDTLESLRDQAPEFAAILLTRDLDVSTVRYATDLGVSAVCARTELIADHPEAITALRGEGIGMIAYTLNTESEWRSGWRLGIDFFVTDDPVALTHWRDSMMPEHR